jgi:hypothetical protein
MNGTQSSQAASDTSTEMSPTSNGVSNDILKETSALDNNSHDNACPTLYYSSSDHEVPFSWTSSDSSSDDSSSRDSSPLPITNDVRTANTILDEASNSEYEEGDDSDRDVEVESSGSSDNEQVVVPQSQASPKKDEKKKTSKKKKAASLEKASKKRISESHGRNSTSSPQKSGLQNINLEGGDEDDDKSIEYVHEGGVEESQEEIPLFTDIRKTLDSSIGNIPRSNLPYFSSQAKSSSKPNLGRQFSAPNFRYTPPRRAAPRNSLPSLPRYTSVSNVGPSSRTPVNNPEKGLLSTAQASNRVLDTVSSDDDSSVASLDADTKMALEKLALGSFKTLQASKPKLILNLANKTDSGFIKNTIKKSASLTAAPKKLTKKSKKSTSLVEMRKKTPLSNDGGKTKKKKSSGRSSLSSLNLSMPPNTAKDLLEGKNDDGKQKSKSYKAKAKKTKKPKTKSLVYDQTGWDW